MQLDQNYLSAVLPSQGRRIYCFIMPALDPSKPADRRTVQYDFDANDVVEPNKIAAWAVGKQADAYVTIGGAGPATKTVLNGKHAGEQRLSREATNSEWHRSLRIDVDISNDPAKSPYKTKAEGWAAAKAFVTAANMPAPLVVDSGYGLHIYWPFDRDISTAEWLPLAQSLANAVAAHNFTVDPTTTVDAVRILRVPGTFNFKNGGAVPVRMLCDGPRTDPAVFRQLLASYPAPVQTLAGAIPMAMRNQQSVLEAGLHPPYTLKGVLTGCPGLLKQFETGGRNAPEPLWHGTLALVWKAADDDAKKELVAKALSKGHPSYSDGEFYAKWEQVKAQNYEPPTCEKFAQYMPECATCPLRLTVKSPVVMGRMQPQLVTPQQAVPTPPPTPIMQAPAAPQAAFQTQTVQGCFAVTPGSATIQIVDGPLTGWLCVKDGFPCRVKFETNPVAGGPDIKVIHRIGHYRITAAERLLDDDGKQALTALMFDRNQDGHRRVEISFRELSGVREFTGLMQQNGVYFNAADSKDLQDKFMPEFLAQLQRLRQANTIAGRCGWTPDFRKFVLGTRIYDANGDEHIRPSSSPQEMEAYHVLGDRQLWREAFDLNIAAGAERQAILALGIAGPLMAFAGVDGVLLNAYSPESGVGKSTLCDAVLSIWGAPDKLRKDYRDTAAATFHLASISGNLPMVIDEFTNVDGRDLSNYVYTITQGRERHRLGADAKLRENVNRWCLPAIATSNNSVHDKLQSYRIDAAAEAARVFEMRLQPLVVDPANMGAQKRILQQMKTNYGFLGPEIVNMFVVKGETYWRKVVTDRISWWDNELAEDTGDRFRSVVAALIEIGAALGAAMGFAFDRAAVVDCVRTHWKQQVKEFEEARLHPQDFVTAYIADNISKFMVFGDGGAQVSQLQGDFAGEVRTSTIGGKSQVQAVLIPAQALRKYIAEKNGNYKAITEWLAKEAAKGGGICTQTGQMRFMNGTARSLRMMGFRLSPEIMGQTTLAAVPSAVNQPLNATGTP